MGPNRWFISVMVTSVTLTLTVLLTRMSWTTLEAVAHHIYSVPPLIVLGTTPIMLLFSMGAISLTILGMRWVIDDLTNHFSFREAILALPKVGACSILGYLAITCLLLLPDI